MKTVIGNWKMNLTIRESIALARSVRLGVRGKVHVPDIVVCPPFTVLADVRKILSRSRVQLGAQDMFWEPAGAFTGEVSAKQLADVGCTHVIVGHSERRHLLGESDAVVNRKLLAALHAGMTPILCVGETAEERKKGNAAAVVQSQIDAALEGAHLKRGQKLFIAYEPVWAIGTGDAATPEDAVEMHQLIRDASTLKAQILYGGSVDDKNAYDFLREPEVDGVLVGGASIRATAFSGILAAAQSVMEAQANGE